MATDVVLTKESCVDIKKSVEAAIEKFETSFGDLYHKGKIKTVDEPGREKLMELNGKLNDFKCDIDRFQSDIKKVCSNETCQLDVPYRHITPNGLHNDRDSGYSSDLRLSVASNTSEQSYTTRLSKGDPNDLPRISSDEAELFNPSRSGSNSSMSDGKEDGSEKPKFYIKVVDSETSLTDLSELTTSTHTSDSETIPKTPVEQVEPGDNTKLPNTYQDIRKGRYELMSHEGKVQKVVEEKKNHNLELHEDTDQIKNEGINDDNVSKVVDEENDDKTALNNLSTRSSEEDNTKYAA